MPAKAASPPTSAPTGSLRSAPGRASRVWLSFRRLLGGAARYVINAAAIAYMRGANLPQDVVDRLAGHAARDFGSHEEWTDHLRALDLADLRVTPDPARAASEAALWGAIEAEGLLAGAVVVSDDAGQFRVGDHALCFRPRRAPRPQARPRQRRTAQRRRGRQADDLVVLSALE
jgi:hypothetical protein